MTLLVILFLLVLLFAGGGASYGRWAPTGPVWGSRALYVLAVLVLVLFVLRLFFTPAPGV